MSPRFEQKYIIDPETECWEWVAYRMKSGYGQFSDQGRVVYAHRYSYEQHHGPIPDGMQVDHLCRNRACVNPAHLESVTQQENLRRGVLRTKRACPRGHEYDYAQPSNGSRRCSACDKIHADRQTLRRRMAAQLQEIPQ